MNTHIMTRNIQGSGENWDEYDGDEDESNNWEYDEDDHDFRNWSPERRARELRLLAKYMEEQGTPLDPARIFMIQNMDRDRDSDEEGREGPPRALLPPQWRDQWYHMKGTPQ